MKIDLSQVQDTQDFPPIPPGSYLCRLDNVEETFTRNGDPKWKLSFSVRDGEHKERLVFDNMSFSSAAMPRVKHICSAFNLDTTGEIDLTPEMIRGQDVLLAVDVEEYETTAGEQRKTNCVQFRGYERPDTEGF